MVAAFPEKAKEQITKVLRKKYKALEIEDRKVYDKEAARLNKSIKVINESESDEVSTDPEELTSV